MKLGWGVACAVISAGLMAVSRDSGYVGWLVLLAPVPLLVYALRAEKAGWPFVLAFVVGVAGEAGPVLFYGGLIPMIYVLAAGQGLAFACSVRFLRALDRRLSPAAGLFGFAAMTAAIDYLYGLVSPNGSFGALGYNMVDVSPLLATASLTGVAGLTFWAALIQAGLAKLCVAPRDRVVFAWATPVVLALLAGLWLMTQSQGPAVRIALLSNDRYAGVVVNHPRANAEAAKTFQRQIDAVAPQHPVVIVLPEKILAVGTVLTPPRGSVIVAGLEGPGAGTARLNQAALYRDGTPVLTYEKKRMVPGLEAQYMRGHEELTTAVSGRPTGVAICKDMDFAGDLRLYGRRDVALMLVPAWDFGGDARLHGRMAVVRGVENGFAVARTASEGLMTLTGANGLIVARKFSTEGPQTLVADLPTGLGHTIYSRIGDVFAQGLVALWVGLSAWLIWRRRGPGTL